MKFLQDMEKEKLIEIILDKRIYDGCPDETMPRCPYNIGDEQKECENFEMMDGYVDGEPFYCNNCLIENSKGWCEIGYDDHNDTEKYAHNLTTNHFGGDTGIDADYMKGAEK